jgi:hypothetical protein
MASGFLPEFATHRSKHGVDQFKRSFVDVVNQPRSDPHSSDHVHDSRSSPISNWQASTSPSPSHVSPTPSPQHNPPSNRPASPQPLNHPPPCPPLPLLGCSRCLDPFNLRPSCKSQVRCKACYHYGHIRHNCLRNKRKIQNFRIKAKPTGRETNLSPALTPVAPPPNPAPSAAPPPPPPCYHHLTDDNGESMANYPCDPHPHLPPGADIVPQCIHHRRRAFHVFTNTPLINCDDWAVIILEPKSDPAQFVGDAALIRAFLNGQGHHVRQMTRSAMGVALI